MKARRCLVVLLSAVFAGCSRGPTPGQSGSTDSPPATRAQVADRLAAEHFRTDHSIERARAGFQDAIKLDPAYATPYYNLAILAVVESRWTEAAGLLREFRKRDQTSAQSVKAQRLIDRYETMARRLGDPKASQHQAYNQAYVIALVALEGNRLRGALGSLNAALRIDGGGWEALAVKAAMFTGLGKFQDAQTLFKQALANAPADRKKIISAEIESVTKKKECCRRTLAGDQAVRLNQLSRAFVDYEEALKLTPDDAYLAIKTAEVAMIVDKLDAAGSILDHLGKLRNPLFVSKVSQLKKRWNDLRGKDAELSVGQKKLAGLAGADQYVEKHCAEGERLQKLTKYDQAIEEYNLALAAKPDSNAVLSRRGGCLLDKREFGNAADDYARCLKTNPTFPVYFLCGYGRFMDDNFDDAIRTLTNGIHVVHDKGALAKLYGERGDSYRIKGDLGASISDYTESIRLDQSKAGVWESRGDSYYFRSEFDRAKKDYKQTVEIMRQSLRKEPAKADRLNDLAWQLATCPDETVRRGDEAVGLATKACELTNWDSHDHLDTLAAAYAESGQFQNAAKYEEQAIVALKRKGFGSLNEYEDRLAAYRKGKAYARRQEAVK